MLPVGGEPQTIDDAIPVVRSRRKFLDATLSNLHCGSQFGWLQGFGSYSKESNLVATACNHPNCLVLPFRLELIRLAA